MVHSMCYINASITDFNFEPLLTWLSRIPPDQEANLSKNDNLHIGLHTTNKPQNMYGDSLRRWLHLRADQHRPQPKWAYKGPSPKPKVANDLKRRAKRMTEAGKRAELVTMLRAIEIAIE